MSQKEILERIADNAYLLKKGLKVTSKMLSSKIKNKELSLLRLFYVKICLIKGYSQSSSTYLINRTHATYYLRLKRLDKIGLLNNSFKPFKNLFNEE
jgi:hypothetical protein